MKCVDQQWKMNKINKPIELFGHTKHKHLQNPHNLSFLPVFILLNMWQTLTL